MSKIFSRLLGTSAFVGIFLGCGTTSKQDVHISPSSQAPAYDFLVQNRDSNIAELTALPTSSENQMWWKKYRLGLLNLDKSPKLACGFFSELSKTSHFPLKDIALLRAHASCDDIASLTEVNPEQFRTNYKFAHELIAEVALKEARKSVDKKDDIEALRNSARLETIPRKKEKHLLEAIQISEDLKDTALADDIKTQLYRSSPRLNPDLPAKELPAAAMDFRQRREFEKAHAIYQTILKDPKSTEEEKFQALKSIRMTYKVAQNKNSYIEATADMVNFSKANFKKNKKKSQQSIRHLHESYILLARTLWTEDQTSLGLKYLNEAQRQLKGLHPMDEVYFILARMAEEKNDLVKATEYYEGSLQENISSQGARDRVTWSYPWLLYKRKNYEAAAKIFREHIEKSKDGTDRTRSQFWLARTLKKLNRPEEANEVLTSLVKDDPIGYYGVIAVRELGQTYPALRSNEKDFSYSLFNLNELTPLAALQGEWLMAVGENSFSEKVIDQVADGLKKKNRADEHTWLIILTSYARANLYIPLFAAFGGLPQPMKETMVLKHPELLFPRDYKELIIKAAASEQIPSEFTFSIIRQESAFNPRARSPADAFGLMQLLPSLAKKLSRGTEIPYKEAEDLYEPDINVPLGTKELRNLLKRYDNQYILAVSAYNASANAIAGWLRTRYREDALEFIEEVPYDETRTYIKLTMRNFVFYKRLNQTGDQVQFPEEWLRLVSK